MPIRPVLPGTLLLETTEVKIPGTPLRLVVQ